jgi:hypothetical protein
MDISGGVLSGRLIIFREDQVHYQCRGMHCSEAIVSPLTALHTENNGGFHSRSDSRIFPNYSFRRGTSQFLATNADCSARDLTYDRDIVDGISGTLQLFETSKAPMSHVYGVPIYGACGCRQGSVTDTADSTHRFGIGLHRKLHRSSSRRL